MALLRPAMAVVLAVAAAGLLAQGVREEVRIELVRVDLRALDKKGNPVRDLTKEDFRLYVDGKLAKIEGLDPWSQVSFETVREQLPPLPGAPEPAPEPAPPKPPPLFLSVLVDETSISTDNRTPSIRRLDEAISRLPPDVRLQLLYFEGKLRVGVPWTTDAAAVRKALAAPRKAGPRVGPPGGANPTVFPRAAGSATVDAMMMRRFQLEAIDSYQEALRHFPSEPGRKGLIVVTEGGPFLSPINVADEAIEGQVDEQQAAALYGPAAQQMLDRQERLGGDLAFESFSGRRLSWTTQMRVLTTEANRREIALYPFRAADFSQGTWAVGPRGGAEISMFDSGRSPQMTATRSFHAAGTQMEFVADETGGKALLSRGGFGDEVTRVIERRTDGYLLTFRDPTGDHVDHEIRLESARPGLQLAYRRSYRVRPPQDRLLDEAEDALVERRNDNRLGAKVEIEKIGREGKQVVARLRVLYPAVAGTPIEPPPAVQVAGAVLSGEGYRSRPFQDEGPGFLLLQGEHRILSRVFELRIRPGSYIWGLAIRDVASGETSYLTFEKALE
jgi:VWFA-related protein